MVNKYAEGGVDMTVIDAMKFVAEHESKFYHLIRERLKPCQYVDAQNRRRKTQVLIDEGNSCTALGSPEIQLRRDSASLANKRFSSQFQKAIDCQPISRSCSPTSDGDPSFRVHITNSVNQRQTRGRRSIQWQTRGS